MSWRNGEWRNDVIALVIQEPVRLSLPSSDQRSVQHVVNNSCNLQKAGSKLVVSQSNLALTRLANSSSYPCSSGLKLFPVIRDLLIVRHDFHMYSLGWSGIRKFCFYFQKTQNGGKINILGTNNVRHRKIILEQ